MSLAVGIYNMKVKEAKQYLDECLETINRIKGTDIKVIKQDNQRTRRSAKFCDTVEFTMVYNRNNFFKLHINLWTNIDERNKEEFQKALIENIWDQVRKVRREILLEQNQQAILNSVGLSKITLNGLGTYTRPAATPRKEPVYIDPNSVYIDTGAIYNKADVDMTLDLEGYRLQQLSKQSGPIFLTQAEYDALAQHNLINENAWYIVD